MPEMKSLTLNDTKYDSFVDQTARQMASSEKIAQVTNAALAQAKASGEFDGKDGKDGYTPQKGIDYFDGRPGKDGVDGKDGSDGYTPVKGKDYFDGKDGQDGSDGKDGVSPTVSVSAITGGHRITITDANGTKTVDVMDGEDGAPGTNGKDGTDGKTPVKGTDYYTDADKTEMVNDVLAALPTWTGGSY